MSDIFSKKAGGDTSRADEAQINSGGKKKKGGLRRDLNYLVRDFVTCLALCHNVTPIYDDPDDKSNVEFQASSPDEVALVKFAWSLDM